MMRQEEASVVPSKREGTVCVPNMDSQRSIIGHALLPDGIYWPQQLWRRIVIRCAVSASKKCHSFLVVRSAILHADETIRMYDV